MSETIPRPIMVALSILAALKVLAGAAAIADLIGPTATGVTLAVLAAVDIGVATYLQSRVVPLESTIAYERRGRLRAGGASIKPGAVLNSEITVGRLAGRQPTAESWIEDTDNA
jgi:hypothetical protein